MSSSTIGHGHGLHVVIPTTDSRVPPANVTKEPTPFDTPGHGHPLFTSPIIGSPSAIMPPDDSQTPGHGHGLFRILEVGHGHGLFRDPSSPLSASSPTMPKLSARAARRSSLLVSSDVRLDEPQSHDDAASMASTQNTLPATMEAEEPASAEVEGSFKAHSGHERPHAGEETLTDA